MYKVNPVVKQLPNLENMISSLCKKTVEKELTPTNEEVKRQHKRYFSQTTLKQNSTECLFFDKLKVKNSPRKNINFGSSHNFSTAKLKNKGNFLQKKLPHLSLLNLDYNHLSKNLKRIQKIERFDPQPYLILENRLREKLINDFQYILIAEKITNRRKIVKDMVERMRKFSNLKDSGKLEKMILDEDKLQEVKTDWNKILKVKKMKGDCLKFD